MGRQDTLEKGMIHILCGMEWDGMRFHHATIKGIQFKTYKLVISGIFHLIFFWPHLTVGKWNYIESKITDKGTTIQKLQRKIFLISFFCSFMYEKVGFVDKITEVCPGEV